MCEKEMCEIGHDSRDVYFGTCVKLDRAALFRYLHGPDSDDRAGRSPREMRMEEDKEEPYNFL